MALAKVVLPDLGLPSISNCKGTSLAYCKISSMKGLALSLMMDWSDDKCFSITLVMILSSSWINRKEVCSYFTTAKSRDYS